MQVESVKGTHADFSEQQKDAIHQEMERLLGNPYFSNSRRFPAFLRFVIEQTISGHSDCLKERTLGVEIFGRTADYDTSSDPIVRVTAAEIRKRIAQYYQDPGHEHELRISLPPGSYVPQFHWAPMEKDPNPSTPLPATLAEPAPSADRHPVAAVQANSAASSSSWRNAFLALCILLLCGGILAASLWNSSHRTPFDSFWGPVLNTGDPLLFCIADQSQYSAISLRDAQDPTHQTVLRDNLTAVVIDDLNPIVRVAGVLQANGKKYTLRGENSTTLNDLRSGPTIFIGAFDNAWTLRLTKGMHFHFASNADMSEFRIVEGDSPGQTRWIVYRSQQMATNNYNDYAVIARFTDAITGRIAVVIAGVGRGGTIAAGEFLTNPGDLAQLERATRASGNKKNMEIVLSTPIIDGEPGTPKMEASYFW
ncbi:MAG: hypothetical protein M3Y50_16195 [Acidobacteriota bacterium]|nr:hypothetical protein [Acidobacteriota bacterium]